MLVFDLLPADLAGRSLSTREIVLTYPDVLEALEYLTRHDAAVLGWEGWVRYGDGRVGHSREHQGTADLSRLSAAEAAHVCQTTIISAHEAWRRSPEHAHAELYFALTV